MASVINFFRRYPLIILGTIAIFAMVAALELHAGRLPLGPDGMFGWWESDVWSSENSQRVADAYSFSHIIHGILFYAFLWLVARRIPVRYRFLLSLIIEAVWEILENSPLVIDRYREATIALGYAGDSILNSLADVAMAAIGFAMARFLSMRTSIILIVIMELGCLLWVRDNLTLNVIMLVHPVEALKAWQSVGH